jgi:AraC-like DNA-binding protein
MHGPLKLDSQVTPELRVRDWNVKGPGVSGGPTGHPALEIAWVDEGSLVYRLEGGEIRVGPGQAIVIPVKTEHATSLSGPGRFGSVWLGEARMEALSEALSTAQVVPGLLPSPERLIALGRLLRSEVGEAQRGYLTAADALSEALAIEALRRTHVSGTRESSPDVRIRAALDLMESCYAEPLSIENLARAAGLSRFHFSREFRDQLGVSPYRYLTKLRVRKAAQLIERRRASVTEAAFSVGFGDLSRFARAFRAQFGCSPREWKADRAH